MLKPDGRLATTLISSGRLRELLEAGEPLTVIDVRWSLSGPPGIEAYARGHVPGAVFVDLDTELADPPGEGGRHPLPSAERFAEAMRHAGVSRHLPVVVYDQRDSSIAARAWWLLRYHGHPDVRLLDGGMDAWTAAGGAVSVYTGRSRVGDFASVPGGMPVLTSPEQVLALAERGGLLDARAAERYRGESEPVDPVAGHIPGAISAPTADNVDGHGRFLSEADLRARFDALGLSDVPTVGVYCGSGVTAAHEVLALDLAGIPAALYPGSWSGWITDTTRPVATGVQPR
ncbi:MAG: sulfurtransferase [Nocardioidaceae bacterium]